MKERQSGQFLRKNFLKTSVQRLAFGFIGVLARRFHQLIRLGVLPSCVVLTGGVDLAAVPLRKRVWIADLFPVGEGGFKGAGPGNPSPVR